MNAHWRIPKDGKVADHWLDLEDPEGWYKASVRGDGCIHFNRAFNLSYDERKPGDEEAEDYLHICDIDGLIARLQSLKQAALAHFRTWPQ